VVDGSPFVCSRLRRSSDSSHQTQRNGGRLVTLAEVHAQIALGEYSSRLFMQVVTNANPLAAEMLGSGVRPELKS
jgi:hypothetical protein